MNNLYRLDSMIAVEFGNTYKHEYTYDISNQRIEQITYTWSDISGNFQWEYQYKDEYLHDPDWNILTHINSWYLNSQWSPWLQINFFYDNNFNLITEEHSGWYSNQWAFQWKTEYTYDSTGTLILTFSYQFNNNQWELKSKTEYSYALSLLTLTERFDWTGGQWVPYQRKVYAYDSADFRILYEHFDWTGNQWTATYKYEYLNDMEGNLLESIVFIWNPGQWIIVNKWEYVLDTSFNLNDLLVPYWYKYGWYEFNTFSEFKTFKTMVLYYGLYFWYNNQWANVRDYTFYYSLQPTNIHEIDESTSLIYPNPVSDVMYFRLPQHDSEYDVNIYDIQGKNVMAAKTALNNPISVKELNPGMYFYILSGKKNNHTGKFIKVN
jgi:hypothetical protein